MDPLTMIGTGIVALSGLAYVYPKGKAYLNSRNASILPHDAVKTLIDYFTTKKCKAGVKASVDVGKLLYEECTQHDEEPVPTPTPVNNLP